MTAEQFLQLGEDPVGVRLELVNGEVAVSHYWIVDPAKRTIEACKLVGRKYRLVAQGKGIDIVNLPPFEDLDLTLGDLWQPAND